MLDAIFYLLYDFGVTWLAAAPTCPRCGGQGMRPKQLTEGKQRWHCRGCCHEWLSSRFEAIAGDDK